MRYLSALLLICPVVVFGCGPRKDAQLYIYCNETFWYVMQEEALFFNKNHGFQVILIPDYVDQTVDKTEGAVEINTDRHVPAPWTKPSEKTDTQTVDSGITISPEIEHINPEIKRRIEQIAEEHFGDLYLSDSQQHIDMIRKTALSTNEYPICYLTLTMLVPMGNPHQFHSVKDVLDAHRTLGIVDPSLGGLGESSWKVLGKIKPAIPMELVHFYKRQYDLLEALEQGTIDAALVWNSSSQFNFLLVKYSDEYNTANEKLMQAAERKKDVEKLRRILQEMCKDLVERKTFAEEVPLTENPDERCVVAVRLVTLSSAFNFGYCERFADFMRSKQGKEVLRRFGFVTE